MLSHNENKLLYILLLVIGAWGIAVFEASFWEIISVITLTVASYNVGKKSDNCW